MLYAVLKLFVRLALWVFYRKLVINLPKNMPTTGPLIVVSNHPNTLMDPLVIASFLKPQIYFLAKGSMFNSPFKKWLLGMLNMVPIYRKEDLKDVEGDNEAVFQKCYDFLEGKGTLLIFPEGTSVHERNLRRLKTGTARIALGAEQANDFQLGLQLLTVGLNYSDAAHFRTDLTVNVDEPITVQDFKELYQEDAFGAAEMLTGVLRKKLSKHVIISRSHEEDKLARQIEDIYRGRLFAESELPKNERDFQISRNIVEALKHFAVLEPERVAALKGKIEVYENNLGRLKLRSSEEGEVFQVGNRKQLITSIIYLVLAFPLYVYGLIHNYIPYIIPSMVARKVVKEVEYIASFMMVVGMFTFPIFYGLCIYACYALFGSVAGATIYGLSLPLTGFLVLHYWRYLNKSQNYLVFISLFKKRKRIVQGLLDLREEILQELEKAKEEWIALQEDGES